MKIKAYTHYTERTKTHYYREFEVVESIPEVENLDELIKNTSLNSWLDNCKCVEINELELDCEQGNQNVYNYVFYEVVYVDIADYHYLDDEDKDINDFISKKYVCIKRVDDFI